MKSILAGNIARYRKAQGMTQEELAGRLHISYQAVSKWETGAACPDIGLLTPLAAHLGISVDQLLGYDAGRGDLSYYEEHYRGDAYFWGINPSRMCLHVLEHMPPTRRLKLLDIGCGEGKDAVFFARCGYEVSAFDISEAGLDKVRRLADSAGVQVRAFQANLWDFRLTEPYDILFSSGVLHYIKPELRQEIMGNYREHIRPGGIAAFHVFVDKPFLPPAPEQEAHSYPWKSGELFTCFHDWRMKRCDEIIFDCNSSGIPHQHAANRMIAQRPES